MITLKDKIQNDLSSSVNNFDLLFVITASGNTYHLSTQSQTLDGIYYDDLIMKVGGLKESINLKDKKIKLSGTSISINNAEMSGKRFSDTIVGEMSGGIVDIYIKTQSCESLDDCNTIASLKITGVTHDSSKIDLKCEDRYIDEFHKELPLSEHTLYEDEKTFTAYNERRIPILYGHLKQAPAVVYIDNHESGSAFTDNNIKIVPDRAFLDDSGYDIAGIKDINERNDFTLDFGSEYNMSTLILDQDVLSIKLGDYGATVYKYTPYHINWRMLFGDSYLNYAHHSRWSRQFEVNQNSINLFTHTEEASEDLKNRIMLVGELSKLKSVSRREKYRYYQNTAMIEAGQDNEYSIYSEFNPINPTPLFEDNFDRLSLPSFFMDDIDGEEHSGVTNMMRMNLGRIWIGTGYLGYVTTDLDNDTILDGWDYKPYDIPSITFEFEPIKSNVSKAKDKMSGDTYSDGSIICNIENNVTQIGNSTQNTNIQIKSMLIAFTPLDITSRRIEVGSTTAALGVPSYVHKAVKGHLDSDGNNVDGYPVWRGNQTSTNKFCSNFFKAAPFLVSTGGSFGNDQNTNHGDTFTDYKHSFHHHQIATDDMNDFNNTRWKWIDPYDIEGANIFSINIAPSFDTSKVQDIAMKTKFNGMFYRRSWLEESVFEKDFFVNAKGKYTENDNTAIKEANFITINFYSEQIDDGETHARREYDDKALFLLLDYLGNDRLKRFYEEGDEYQIILEAQVSEIEFGLGEDYSEQCYLYDIDITNVTRVGAVGDELQYRIDISCKIFRDEGYDDNEELWDSNNPYLFGKSVKLMYGKKSFTDTGEFDGFTINENNKFSTNVNDDGTTETSPFIDFLSYPSPRYVNIAFPLLNIQSTSKELIRKPSDVIDDVVWREFKTPHIERKDIEDSSYLLDFSIYEAEEGIDTLKKITQCSPFFYKTNISNGVPKIVGIKHSYADSDVDKSINENQIMNYKFNKSRIEDVSIECRVKYGFDYVKEEYTKTTETLPLDSDIKQEYINLYNILDEESYVLEHEAPYIQDSATAERLVKHIYEINKNQHLILTFQIPLGDGIELEVGDTIDFIDNTGNRININNTKPYGMDMTIENTIIDQVVYPYFMITSIKKDLTKVDIECVQLHNLAPSIYDYWFDTEIIDDPVVASGDANLDGVIDVVDIIVVVGHILGDSTLSEEAFAEADINGDGNVDIFDIIQIMNIVLNI